MKKYTVQQLADLAGVSVRTLHHYDELGLLIPASRSEKGYRYYSQDELLRLQQILLYKELDIPLKEIAELLESPGYDIVTALEQHRIKLAEKKTQLATLLQTIDKTIESLKNNKYMITNKELYEGFTKEEAESMRAEVTERWGEKELLDSQHRVKQMNKQQWSEVKQEGEDVSKKLAALMHLSPADKTVQLAIREHYNHIGRFYEVSAERYMGLGKLYVEDERFTAYYEKYATGLAAFIEKGIEVFCDNGLKVE